MLRFVASPTGNMDLDTLHIALVNYLVSRQRNKPLLVRIDDTEKEDVIEGKDTEIIEILKKFAINHERTCHQSEYLHHYQTLAIRLLKEKKAFICTCNSIDCNQICLSRDQNNYDQLKESGEPFTIRIRKPDENIVYRDTIQDKVITAPHKIGNFIILQNDATPTSSFATACADILNGVDLIIESTQKIHETAKQVYIKKLLGYHEACCYAHLPSLLNSKGKPLVEDDNFSLLRLFSDGFIPDAIINNLLLLHITDFPKEIFYFSEMVEWFKLEEAPKEPMVFDIKKLRHINRMHLRMMDDKQLSILFGFADADIGKLAKLYLDEAATINELATKIRPILAPKVFEGAWAKQMRQIQQVLIDAPMLDTFDKLEAYVIQKTNLRHEKLDTPLRLLLTGTQQGPNLQNIYTYIRSYLLEVIS
ncbi:MAG: glutamate--tRNA ligase [Sulfurovum sp.]|nr:glutamate--tRNA ligase [Sulfurovum sp.]